MTSVGARSHSTARIEGQQAQTLSLPSWLTAVLPRLKHAPVHHHPPPSAEAAASLLLRGTCPTQPDHLPKLLQHQHLQIVSDICSKTGRGGELWIYGGGALCV